MSFFNNLSTSRYAHPKILTRRVCRSKDRTTLDTDREQNKDKRRKQILGVRTREEEVFVDETGETMNRNLCEGTPREWRHPTRGWHTTRDTVLRASLPENEECGWNAQCTRGYRESYVSQGDPYEDRKETNEKRSTTHTSDLDPYVSRRSREPSSGHEKRQSGTRLFSVYPTGRCPT